MAAASIAQVHFAVTAEGEEVAVKILRPGIEAAIERDLDFLLWLAEWAERLRPALRRYRPVDTVRMLALTTRREMDLRLEAAAAAEFRQNCLRGRGLQGARGSTGAAPDSAWSPSSGWPDCRRTSGSG